MLSYILWHLHCGSLVADIRSSTIQFDTQDSQLAFGNLDCGGDRIDVVSIEYYSNSNQCDNIVCPEATVPTFLDGKNAVCSNENNIRMRCFGQQSCEFGRDGVLVTAPPSSCFTQSQGMLVTHMRILHRCVPKGKYRNIETKFPYRHRERN